MDERNIGNWADGRVESGLSGAAANRLRQHYASQPNNAQQLSEPKPRRASVPERLDRALVVIADLNDRLAQIEIALCGPQQSGRDSPAPAAPHTGSTIELQIDQINVALDLAGDAVVRIASLLVR